MICFGGVSKRIDKINSLIKRTFGEILLQEADLPNDVLVTVSSIETKPNLQSATVWLYISSFDKAQDKPQRAQEVFELIEGQLYELQGFLNKKLSMRPLPRIMLKLDHGSEHASKIEKRLAELDSSISEDSS